MTNGSLELDSADILKTYHRVNDTPHHQNRIVRTKLQQKNKELTEELSVLKEKYLTLQTELTQRETRLSRLKQQLVEQTEQVSKLQEDFEHAIYQLTNRKEG